MIIQIENAISARKCRQLMDIYDRNIGLSDVSDYTGHPVLYWMHVQDIPNAKALFTDLITRCIRHVTSDLRVSAPIFPETAILATMGPGGHHPRHADNRQEDEHGKWIPNHTPNRAISAIYYLDGNFEGGELVFEQHNLVVKPRRGLLVAFPSDERHVHEVLPVRSGRRYTATLWFTDNRQFALTDFEGCAYAAQTSKLTELFTRLRHLGMSIGLKLYAAGATRTPSIGQQSLNKSSPAKDRKIVKLAGCRASPVLAANCLSLASWD